MKEPVDHILRPRLPWRAVNEGHQITECGYDATKVPTIDRDAYLQRLKDMGQQRAALLTCMTCSDTTRRWGTWEDDPRMALQREIEWEGVGRWSSRTDRGQLLRDELSAIAALIGTYRAEFDLLVAAENQRREWNERKAAFAKRPKLRQPSTTL